MDPEKEIHGPIDKATLPQRGRLERRPERPDSLHASMWRLLGRGYALDKEEREKAIVSLCTCR